MKTDTDLGTVPFTFDGELYEVAKPQPDLSKPQFVTFYTRDAAVDTLIFSKVDVASRFFTTQYGTSFVMVLPHNHPTSFQGYKLPVKQDNRVFIKVKGDYSAFKSPIDFFDENKQIRLGCCFYQTAGKREKMISLKIVIE